MSLEQSNIPVKQSSNRSFGLVFTVVFLIVGVFPVLNGGDIYWPSMLLAAIILGVTFIAPQILTYPNALWTKFGLLLGAVVAPVMLLVVYLLTIVPIGLMMRVSGKKLLDQGFDQSKQSYWIKRERPPQEMKNQF